MRKKKFFKRNGGQFLERQFDSGEADVEETKLFESEELEKATDSFKIDRVLGQGGQGIVYKGMLADIWSNCSDKEIQNGQRRKNNRVHQRGRYSFTNQSQKCR